MNHNATSVGPRDLLIRQRVVHGKGKGEGGGGRQNKGPERSHFSHTKLSAVMLGPTQRDKSSCKKEFQNRRKGKYMILWTARFTTVLYKYIRVCVYIGNEKEILWRPEQLLMQFWEKSNITSRIKLVCEIVEFCLRNCYHVLRKQGQHINKEEQHRSVHTTPGGIKYFIRNSVLSYMTIKSSGWGQSKHKKKTTKRK